MKINKKLLQFIEKSPSVFHNIETIKTTLLEKGYTELLETQEYKINKNGKYFVSRNMSSIIAFHVGSDLENYSFNIVASHNDSPCFKIKPIADLAIDKYSKLSVEGYGGMLCASWFDRPLSVAGRVFIKDNNQLKTKLVNIDKDILMLPSVAIHLNREANDGLKYNLNIDMQPFFGKSIAEKKPFLSLLANTLQVAIENIVSYDLYLYNRQHGYIWGFDNEFISAPKLDDLQCVFASLEAFIDSSHSKNINLFCCFDNEEVGSTTRQGANSTFLEDTLNRINHGLGFNQEKFQRAIASSLMISADNAHAVHPNHPELSDGLNRVYMNDGIVIKYNAAQSYTSDGLSSAIFKQLCNLAEIKYQEYTNRADLRGGGTLGNISSAHVSIAAVDIGLAQLAMHSSFETSGANDTEALVKGLKVFYSHHIEIDKEGNIII